MNIIKPFKELPVGTIFICSRGKFKKIKEGHSKFEGNAIGVNYPREVAIQGSMLCTIIE